MATYIKHGKDGSERGHYFRKLPNGEVIRASKVFTKAELAIKGKDSPCRKWEDDMDAKFQPISAVASLHTLIDRYVAEITPTKRSAKTQQGERCFFKRLKKHDVFKADRGVNAVTSEDIQVWVDDRLDAVESGTVYREFNMVQDFFRQCASKVTNGKRVWRALTVNPCNGVSRPKDSKDAGKLITPAQRAKFLAECKSDDEKEMGKMFEFAIETGMRRSEVCLIDETNIQPEIVVLYEGTTKNGKGRNIPLTPRARQLVGKNGFRIKAAWKLSMLFVAVRKRCGFDFRFHDTRHTAATFHGNSGLHSEFDLMDWFGWADAKIAKRYVKTNAIRIANRFAPAPAALRLAA